MTQELFKYDVAIASLKSKLTMLDLRLSHIQKNISKRIDTLGEKQHIELNNLETRIIKNNLFRR